MDTVCVLALRYRYPEVRPMELPFDPDGEEMGYWVDRWLHNRRLRGATSRELTLYAQRLASAVQRQDEADDIARDFLQFASGELGQ